MKKILCLLLCILMACSVGCRKNNNDITDPKKTEAPTAVPLPKEGGTLTLPIPNNAVFNDPMTVNTEEMLLYYSLVYESLLSIDDSGSLSPSLAESWEIDSTDTSGTVWIINLRQSVFWHNSTEFSADDVLFSFNRLKNISTGNNGDETEDNISNAANGKPVYAQLSLGMKNIYSLLTNTDPIPTDSPNPSEPIVTTEPLPTEPILSEPPKTDTPIPSETPLETVFSPIPEDTPDYSTLPENSPTVTSSPLPSPTPGSVIPMLENSSSYYKYYVDRIDSIEKTDTYIIKVKMKEPGISSLYALTFPIMQKAGNENIGTGPYAVKKASAEKIELTANTNWWKQSPYIKSVVFVAKADNDTALASYEAGQLNFVITSSISAGKYRKEGKANISDIMTQTAEILFFNNDNRKLRDIDVRKAILYGINTSRIISNSYMNKVLPCDVPIAPDSFLYDSSYKQYTYDVDTAKRLLEKAGYTDSNNDGILEYGNNANDILTLRLLVNETTDNTARVNAADSIAAFLKQIGISVTVETCAYSLSDIEGSEYIKKLANGDFDLALCGVNLSYDFDLRPMLTVGSNVNFGRVNNTELLQLANEIVKASSVTEMREKATVFQKAFIEQLPFAVLGFRLNSLICDSTIYLGTAQRAPYSLRNIDKWFFRQ